MAYFIGEIILVGFNFAPVDFLPCDGRVLAIAEYDTLFNLIGTTYGGDGQQTFNLPDLRGRVPVHMGQGPGLSNYIIGESAGTESVILITADLPSHQHVLTFPPPALACQTSPGTSRRD